MKHQLQKTKKSRKKNCQSGKQTMKNPQKPCKIKTVMEKMNRKKIMLLSEKSD